MRLREVVAVAYGAGPLQYNASFHFILCSNVASHVGHDGLQIENSNFNGIICKNCEVETNFTAQFIIKSQFKLV